MANNKIVCFINMKGGVGKTTLAVNAAYTLAKHFKKKVLLIDLDPQMNSTQYCLNVNEVQEIIDNPKKTIYGIFEPELPSIVSPEIKEGKVETQVFNVVENFDIIPSHLSIMLSNIGENPLKLKRYIRDKDLMNNYDIIIIDAPPTMSGYTKAALLCSNYYIVPMKIDYLSLFGLPLLQNYIQNLGSEYEATIAFSGIILTMTRPDHRIYRSLKEKINNNSEWKKNLFNAELKHKIIIANALSPDNGNSENAFIYNLGDVELKNQIINITAEFMQKIRL